jgi:glyoxylase-like metal-dependent hydrolase (beta-lactamase superfamily II)
VTPLPRIEPGELASWSQAPPAAGTLERVADGVSWLRMPLPMVLNHINLWVLEDEAGWWLVDTGINDGTTRGHWEALFAGPLAGRPVAGVIVTHLHPDHVGLAGWLTERFDVPLHMSRTEFLLCRTLVADTGQPAPREAVAFFRGAGYDEEELENYRQRFGGFGRAVAPLPNGFVRLRDGQTLVIGGREWRVVVGTGHSPEHACLHCPELDLVISGDQILPSISSNISVWPTEPEADPLADWLESCERLQRVLPEDVLVLPSHGRPFHGAHVRLRQLIAEHAEGLERLAELCAEPRRAVDVFPALFKSRITAGNLLMATTEAIAHLHYLEARGELVRETRDGVHYFRRA